MTREWERERLEKWKFETVVFAAGVFASSRPLRPASSRPSSWPLRPASSRPSRPLRPASSRPLRPASSRPLRPASSRPCGRHLRGLLCGLCGRHLRGLGGRRLRVFASSRPALSQPASSQPLWPASLRLASSQPCGQCLRSWRLRKQRLLGRCLCGRRLCDQCVQRRERHQSVYKNVGFVNSGVGGLNSNKQETQGGQNYFIHVCILLLFGSFFVHQGHQQLNTSTGSQQHPQWPRHAVLYGLGNACCRPPPRSWTIPNMGKGGDATPLASNYLPLPYSQKSGLKKMFWADQEKFIFLLLCCFP